MRHYHPLLTRPLAIGLALASFAVATAHAGEAGSSTFACTKLSRNFWLPLSILVERLENNGSKVTSAVATIDDCYEIQVANASGAIRTMLYHPVSGKPLTGP